MSSGTESVSVVNVERPTDLVRKLATIPSDRESDAESV
jgi:hypothetical protein